MRGKIWQFVFAAGIATAVCLAQDPERPKNADTQLLAPASKPQSRFFKFDFVLKEMDGSKVMNARSYSMYAATDTPSSIRTGVKVQEGDAAHPNWTDIGARIDVRDIREIEGQLAFNAGADVTGFPQDTVTGPARAIMRQYHWDSKVIVPLRKPTVIFSSDGTTSRNQMQVEVTVTPVL